MNAPKVSFVIPVYNTAKYLDKCMQSVLHQTLTDIEIIIVDDGSTDNVSPGMCDEYAKNDSRVMVIHKPNGGLTSSWIEGSKAASADYLCFVDSDDWVDTVIAKELYALTDASFSDSEIISSNYIVEKAGERRKETQSLAPGVYMEKDLAKLRKHLLGDEVRPVTMSRCMKLISRKLLLSNIRYCDLNVSMSEDVNITLPCLCDCRRLVIAKDSYYYHYRLVAESIAHSYKPDFLKNLELTDRVFREILRDKNVPEYETQMDREFIIILLLILKNELRCPDAKVTSRIRDIVLRPDIKKRIKDTKVELSQKSNRLLYACLRNPNPLMIHICKAVINMYDKMTN